VREVRALLAVSEQGRDDAVVIWVPYRIFGKSDREGGIPQGKPPFRFQPNISNWWPSSAFALGLGFFSGFVGGPRRFRDQRPIRIELLCLGDSINGSYDGSVAGWAMSACLARAQVAMREAVDVSTSATVN
jgi:hypothetical protein